MNEELISQIAEIFAEKATGFDRKKKEDINDQEKLAQLEQVKESYVDSVRVKIKRLIEVVDKNTPEFKVSSDMSAKIIQALYNDTLDNAILSIDDIDTGYSLQRAESLAVQMYEESLMEVENDQVAKNTERYIENYKNLEDEDGIISNLSLVEDEYKVNSQDLSPKDSELDSLKYQGKEDEIIENRIVKYYNKFRLNHGRDNETFMKKLEEWTENDVAAYDGILQSAYVHTEPKENMLGAVDLVLSDMLSGKAEKRGYYFDGYSQVTSLKVLNTLLNDEKEFDHQDPKYIEVMRKYQELDPEMYRFCVDNKEMITEMIRFNDFDLLYDKLGKMYKDQQTPENISKIFKEYVRNPQRYFEDSMRFNEECVEIDPNMVEISLDKQKEFLEKMEELQIRETGDMDKYKEYLAKRAASRKAKDKLEKEELAKKNEGVEKREITTEEKTKNAERNIQGMFEKGLSPEKIMGVLTAMSKNNNLEDEQRTVLIESYKKLTEKVEKEGIDSSVKGKFEQAEKSFIDGLLEYSIEANNATVVAQLMDANEKGLKKRVSEIAAHSTEKDSRFNPGEVMEVSKLMKEAKDSPVLDAGKKDMGINMFDRSSDDDDGR